jgi:putative FmdB family regulatory protein
MPLYEYYCEDCDGIYELLRPMREASNPQPCPVCDGDGRRLMPTELNAFVMRGGMPRRIPDQGLYWTTKGQATKPMTSSDMKKMEPYLVKDPKKIRDSAKLSAEEITTTERPKIEVRPRVKGSGSRGRRRLEATRGKGGR